MEILAATSSGVIRLVRDAVGLAWRIADRTLVGKHVGSLVCVGNGTVFAGCHKGGGIHRSLDGGVTWQQIGNEIGATDIFALAYSPSLVAANLSAPAGTLWAGTEPVNLFRSDDLGDSWQEFPAIKHVRGAEKWTFPPPPHVPHLKSITLDPSNSDSFYGCVEQGALLKTTDGGISWTDVDTMWTPSDPYFRDAHRLLIAPWDPSLLLLATGIGLYWSNNGGVSWMHNDALSKRINYPDGLVASPKDRRVFICGPRDNPLTWLREGGAQSTVCCSKDGGVSWVLANQGLPDDSVDNIEALSISSHPGGYLLLAGYTNGQIYALEDGGDSWSAIAEGVGAISKGGHYNLVAAATSLPAWIRPAAYGLAKRVTGFTARRAATKRLKEYAQIRISN